MARVIANLDTYSVNCVHTQSTVHTQWRGGGMGRGRREVVFTRENRRRLSLLMNQSIVAIEDPPIAHQTQHLINNQDRPRPQFDECVAAPHPDSTA